MARPEFRGATMPSRRRHPLPLRSPPTSIPPSPATFPRSRNNPLRKSSPTADTPCPPTRSRRADGTNPTAARPPRSSPPNWPRYGRSRSTSRFSKPGSRHKLRRTRAARRPRRQQRREEHRWISCRPRRRILRRRTGPLLARSPRARTERRACARRRAGTGTCVGRARRRGASRAMAGGVVYTS